MSRRGTGDVEPVEVEGSDVEADVEGTDTTTRTTASALGDEVVLRGERLTTGTRTEGIGAVRARKTVEERTVVDDVERGVEHADLDRLAVADAEADSGEVETLPDGSLSIPVFEEQIVVTKRLVVRERVVVRKHTVYEQHQVTADLRREHLEIDVEGDARVTGDLDPT